MSWRATELDEIPRSGGSWIPVRKHFDIRALGVNAWSAAEAGDEIVSEHKEDTAGHEELYFVTSGHATFTIDGEEVDGPAGTFVFVGEPEALRKAVAKEPGRKDEAIELLSEVAGEPRFGELASSDSDFDSLRDDPRFAQLLTSRS